MRKEREQPHDKSIKKEEKGSWDMGGYIMPDRERYHLEQHKLHDQKIDKKDEKKKTNRR